MENGVALGNAWLVFAYPKNKKRYFELRREGKHHGLQSHMERELIWRICDGDFQAFGIEHGSDAGPIPIPKYYFSKTVVVDWNRESVEAFGKKFYEVRVQGQREQEPPDEMQPTELESGPYIIDPQEITAQRERERSHETSLSERKMSREPFEITTRNTRPSEPAPAVKPRMGRKPLVPILSKLVRELINQREFQGKSKKEITALVREKAQERLKNDFYGPNSPSKHTIYAALAAAGWPPTDEK